MTAIATRVGRCAVAAVVLGCLLGLHAAGAGAPGPDPRLQEAAALQAQAGQAFRRGRYQDGLALAERALKLREQSVGKKHPLVAQSLHLMGVLHAVMGDYPKAQALLEQSLRLREELLGPRHPDVATSLNGLGNVYKDMGDFPRARAAHQRELHIREAALGPRHPDVATSLNGLGNVLLELGDYEGARTAHERALKIREEALGPKHPDVARSLQNLGIVHNQMGDYARAAELYQQALQLREEALGPKHPDVAITLSNLCTVQRELQDFRRARDLCERALRLRQEVLGPKHPDVVSALNGLGMVQLALGNHDQAEKMHEEARELAVEVLGPGHPDVAGALANLGEVHLDRGDYDRAMVDFAGALHIREAMLGPQHPDVGEAVFGMGRVLVAQGEYARALPLFQRALSLSEDRFRKYHLGFRQATVTAFLQRQQEADEIIYSLIGERGSQAVLRLALGAALLRKGRTLDEAADIARAIVQGLKRPGDRQRLADLRTLRSRQAALELGGPGRSDGDHFQQHVRVLDQQAEALEEAIAGRSRALRDLHRIPAPEQVIGRVARALPGDAVLIEIMAYRPHDFHAVHGQARRLPERYLALVLFPDQHIRSSDLGPAADVDTAVTHFLAEVGHPPHGNQTAIVMAASELYRRVMAPLIPVLEGRTHVLLAPDSQLNLVPFAALHDGTDYLEGRYRFTYLTSGRGLLREGQRERSRLSVTVFADPDFGGGNLRLGLGGLAPLPGARAEAEAIKRLYPAAQLYLGQEATEAALLGVSAPGILHVATHGLFLDDGDLMRDFGSRGIVQKEDARTRPLVNALSRSALVMAGAGAGAGVAAETAAETGGADGLATGLEVAGMNLWGTQLVVLSSCDTGRGDLRTGQGVYGLRRAFFIAGAETLVTSLWKVSDSETEDLMGRFYAHLRRGLGRAEAMDQAAHSVRQRYPDPYYFAPFIVLGEEGALRGR